MRFLGVDYGRGRIGLALGDSDSRLAGPLGVLNTSGGSLELCVKKVFDVAQREGVGALVVGVPFPLNDQTRETEQAKEIRRLIDACRTQSLVVHESNETWSTRMGERQAQESDRRGPADDLAAMVILQTYLDRLS